MSVRQTRSKLEPNDWCVYVDEPTGNLVEVHRFQRIKVGNPRSDEYVRVPEPPGGWNPANLEVLD